MSLSVNSYIENSATHLFTISLSLDVKEPKALSKIKGKIRIHFRLVRMKHKYGKDVKLSIPFYSKRLCLGFCYVFGCSMLIVPSIGGSDTLLLVISQLQTQRHTCICCILHYYCTCGICKCLQKLKFFSIHNIMSAFLTCNFRLQFILKSFGANKPLGL